ncbi:hypothetical protein PNH38_03475 [Anoxybacillus rupiensis]|uniref:Uncharacterized protein n=1 Tax=Anoxybacteroides rupiense TaxID=311460 RepID=A0ABT5W0U7_9BACL|nr:hypothetical protein [Anoxybacillus rupiensis]
MIWIFSYQAQAVQKCLVDKERSQAKTRMEQKKFMSGTSEAGDAG